MRETVVSGDDIVIIQPTEEWFGRIRADENDIMDELAGERPLTTNTELIMEHMELEQHVASRTVAQTIEVSY